MQLGGVAEGTARMVAKRSSLAEYPTTVVDGRSHVEALPSALPAFGKAARHAIDQADDLGDLDTADLFTEVSRGIDKWLWFVEAHLQAERCCVPPAPGVSPLFLELVRRDESCVLTVVTSSGPVSVVVAPGSCNRSCPTRLLPTHSFARCRPRYS